MPSTENQKPLEHVPDIEDLAALKAAHRLGDRKQMLSVLRTIWGKSEVEKAEKEAK